MSMEDERPVADPGQLDREALRDALNDAVSAIEAAEYLQRLADHLNGGAKMQVRHLELISPYLGFGQRGGNTWLRDVISERLPELVGQALLRASPAAAAGEAVLDALKAATAAQTVATKEG